MIQIDGSYGEGGGQILRTSLSLSILTQKDVEIVNIRAKRPKPGLSAQHITAARAATAICRGFLEGDCEGSQAIVFKPGPVHPDKYLFDVAEERGSAGATGLVFQTVFLPLALANAASEVTIRGGTHVPWAPPGNFLQSAFLPWIRKMGYRCEMQLHRAGYYPKGRGEITFRIEPAQTRRDLFTAVSRPRIMLVELRAFLTKLPNGIAGRMMATASRLLESKFVDVQCITEELPGVSEGCCFAIHIADDFPVVFTSFGRRGRPAEDVANEACRDFLNFHRTGAVVDPHLADQLVLPALYCGQEVHFTTSDVTEHVRTNLWVASHFCDFNHQICAVENGFLIVLKPPAA